MESQLSGSKNRLSDKINLLLKIKIYLMSFYFDNPLEFG